MNAVHDVKSRLRGIPLRLKLVTAVLALVAGALLVISVSTAYFLHDYLVNRIDGELDDQLDRGVSINAANNSRFPTDYLVAQWSRNDQSGFSAADQRLSPQDLPAGLNKQDWYDKHANGEAFTEDGADKRVRWRLMVRQDSADSYRVIGQNLTDVDLSVRQLLWIDLLVGGAVLIILASVGAGIVRTSLKPLVEIERTAAAIAGGDLTRRVPDPEEGQPCPTSELGRLSRALNAMLAQIEAAFTARAASEAAARSAEVGARDAAAAAQASEARARRSEERMRQFIADASHELRTPLTTIRGFAELYRQGAARAPEQTADLLRRIEDEASRMGLLVEDLLLLARMDRERPIALAPVELPVLASDAVEAARVVDPDRPIELELEPGAGPLVVLGDDARLRQVIGNLMTNALTHTPPDAAVTLRLRSEAGNLAVVEVADTGPGLTPEQSERVFERFYRVDAARTRRADGPTSTGLGLAIVAALVMAHHGTVEAVGTPGGGATFRVKLPLLAEAPEPGE
ncbi:HAMP domain-containing sensor histidine kinase [Micromonospora sp. NBS 11-29]|uniref:HAMP domain-containing sensor histidine kinase n=1 Tax=Micromonospora sp. NBS 11-29 TaxID=1960879 RepID=UPI000B7733A4|nr:ATP-binding protein [Micromonospora sp. NBS 11-29]